MSSCRRPAAGTYTLPVIQRAPSGVVIEADGAKQPWSRYTTGRVTLLSFIYTYCPEPFGCPLAYDIFVKARSRLVERPELARRVRLVSLSFDPTHDTPAMLRAYAGKYLRDAAGPRWYFLTTGSVHSLLPLLEGFEQDVAVEAGERGRPMRTIDHMLKSVPDRPSRDGEIYSTASLFSEGTTSRRCCPRTVSVPTDYEQRRCNTGPGPSASHR